ncbi:MAG: ElaA protein [Micromonosporaceae bacterium]|jgi:ElaA protein|nr:ElaA protein [Micromonosporaceae bacterium]
MILRAARFAELDPATLYALLRLRVDVFVVEQACPYPELDGRDLEPGSVHLWLDNGDGPAAYLRILDEPAVVTAEPAVARIGRVCTAIAHRGAGHSERLLTAALDLVGHRPCVVNAQSHLADFYARHGFRPTGPQFFDDGIPHLPMHRPPTAGAPT